MRRRSKCAHHSYPIKDINVNKTVWEKNSRDLFPFADFCGQKRFFCFAEFVSSSAFAVSRFICIDRHCLFFASSVDLVSCACVTHSPGPERPFAALDGVFHWPVRQFVAYKVVQHSCLGIGTWSLNQIVNVLVQRTLKRDKEIKLISWLNNGDLLKGFSQSGDIPVTASGQ